MWDLWWTKWHRGRFSPSTSASSANSHSTDCSTLIIYHPGLAIIYNRPVSGRRTKWTQSHPTPRNLKKTSAKVQKAIVSPQAISESFNKKRSLRDEIFMNKNEVTFSD
jgi:hypothetical protein